MVLEAGGTPTRWVREIPNASAAAMLNNTPKDSYMKDSFIVYFPFCFAQRMALRTVRKATVRVRPRGFSSGTIGVSSAHCASVRPVGESCLCCITSLLIRSHPIYQHALTLMEPGLLLIKINAHHDAVAVPWNGA